MSEGRLLKASELAQRLGVAPSSIYRMSSAGLIPSIPVGLKLTGRRFDESAVREALAKVVQSPRPYHPRKPTYPTTAYKPILKRPEPECLKHG
jgi:predicted DNA-binding transcriptional regulator AlpA